MTEQYLKQQLAAGKIRGYNLPAPAKKKKPAIPKRPAKEVGWMHWNLKVWCEARSYQLLSEFGFHQQRKWRFDFAIPALMVGIEYEGLRAEKSRHTTIGGYTGDAEKYNAAQASGWRVLRFTALNYKTVINELNGLLSRADDKG